MEHWSEGVLNDARKMDAEGFLSRRDSRTQPRVSTLGTRPIRPNRPERAADWESAEAQHYFDERYVWDILSGALSAPPTRRAGVFHRRHYGVAPYEGNRPRMESYQCSQLLQILAKGGLEQSYKMLARQLLHEAPHFQLQQGSRRRAGAECGPLDDLIDRSLL
jgi:hypothetical protein